MNNLIVFDWPAEQDNILAEEIRSITGENWLVLGMNKADKHLPFILKLLRDRKKYGKIIFWQQKHGIYWGFISSLLKLKKYNDTFVLTLIYKPESGFKGFIKKLFFTKAIRSQYITKFVCYSEYECQYYSKLFAVPESGFISTILGVADEYPYYDLGIAEDNYLVAAGYSNRDYEYLIDALQDSEYNLRIIDRTCTLEARDNIQILKDVTYGRPLYENIAHSKAAVIPLKDANISSGQTVIIQALMLGKPVIVTESNAVKEYVEDGKNGFIIPKTKEALLEKLELLYNDEALYSRMSENARKSYEDIFSYNALGRRLGEIVNY